MSPLGEDPVLLLFLSQHRILPVTRIDQGVIGQHKQAAGYAAYNLAEVIWRGGPAGSLGK